MKTIKDIELRKDETMPKFVQSWDKGYEKALKDVLGLIDECPYIDNDGNVLEFIKELKARITG